MNTRSNTALLLAGFTLAAMLVVTPATAGTTMTRGAAADAPATWLTVASSGDVKIRATSAQAVDWHPLRRGMELSPMTAVRTGRRSRATLTRGATVLIVDPKSHVELPRPGADPRHSQVVQTAGSVLYEVEGKANPHFKVVTPRLVAGVKGTAFLVSVADGVTSITVQRGLVEVTDTRSGERFDVHAGESVIQREDEAGIDLIAPGERRRMAALRKDDRKISRMESLMRKDLTRPDPSEPKDDPRVDPPSLARQLPSDFDSDDVDDSSRLGRDEKMQDVALEHTDDSLDMAFGSTDDDDMDHEVDDPDNSIDDDLEARDPGDDIGIDPIDPIDPTLPEDPIGIDDPDPGFGIDNPEDGSGGNRGDFSNPSQDGQP